MGAGIAMAALIDHESAAQMRNIELVAPQKLDEVDLSLWRSVHDAGDVAAAPPGHKTQIERRDPRCSGVKNIEAVPAAFGRAAGRADHAGIAGDASRQAERGGAVAAGENTRTQDD